MSIGFLLPDADDAVIWRGPRKNGLIKQVIYPSPMLSRLPDMPNPPYRTSPDMKFPLQDYCAKSLMRPAQERINQAGHFVPLLQKLLV
jgi:hypothetical protein